MFGGVSDNDLLPPTRLARTAWMALAVLAGVALGFTMYLFGLLGIVEWPGVVSFDAGQVAVMVSATATGIVAAFLKPPLPLVTVGVTAALIASTVIGVTSSDSILGFFYGMAGTFCFLLAMLVIAVRRARRNYLQGGWDLAFAEVREHEARIEQAVRRERDAMAGEIHDGLGHRLTLIAVQAGRLSLDESLPSAVRAEMQRIRANAADAADELGETVALLAERTSGVTASLSGLAIADVIERARSSGVTVRAALAPDIEAVAGDHTRAALLRALQEGLTNAAKHAPEATVHVAIDLVEDDIVLQMRNSLPGRRSTPGPPGRGITGLQHRVALLGGTLAVERGEDFTLTVRLPSTAMPSPTADTDLPSSRIRFLTAEAAVAMRRNRRATRQAWLVPLAMFFIAAAVAVGYFVYVTVASVLPPERFAAIEVGDTRAEAALLLPTGEMLDPPSAVVSEPPGAECEYYEATASFADRDDVYQICFADDLVVATMTIPPGY